jgi:TPR repeat protein
MSLAMTDKEITVIDNKVEQMLDWAKTRQVEAEQLTLDSARLLSCTGDRMDQLSNQGFFRRCWSRFSGEAAGMERATTADLVQTQKIALRFINMVSEQQIIMAHTMLSLKNNLLTLAVKEEETRNIVALLAQRTLERFEKLEKRVDQLEISSNLQGWLLGLEERDYDERIPTENMRLFQVINDFYTIKNDSWNYNDMMFMRKALRTVKLDPKKKLSLNNFIDKLVDEIYTQNIGFNKFNEFITFHQPLEIDDYSLFAINEISSPIFVSIHGLNRQYKDRLDVVEILSDQMNISIHEALKILLRKSIENLNVNLNYEYPLAEAAVEILGCLRLASNLFTNTPEIYHDSVAINLKESQYALGLDYYKGEEVTKDLAEAVKLFRLAADQGHAGAQQKLGVCYYKGEGVTRDLDEAVKWVRLAVEQGHPDAQRNLGALFSNGEGVTRDLVEAVKWFRLAAEQGDADAQRRLGDHYYKGEGITEDRAEAVKWFRLAAEQGDADAQNRLCVHYRKTGGLGCAVNGFSLAAEQGDAEAQYRLGLNYFNGGEGVTRDLDEAVKWYRLAAEQGHVYAQSSLALMYSKGEGVTRDLAEATKWFRLAAEQGHAFAQRNLNCLES